MSVILQVSQSGNSKLGQAVTALLQTPHSRLSYKFQPSQLLHLCAREHVLSEIDRDKDVLLALDWRMLASCQPGLALELLEAAMGSASSEADRSSRWQLVRSFVLCLHLPQHREQPSCACLSERA